MDLTSICPMVDNTVTGTAICLNNTPSTDGVASGAFDSSPKTVLNILKYVAAQYGGSTFYGTGRTKQEIAKNVFDQINNNVAFAP